MRIFNRRKKFFSSNRSWATAKAPAGKESNWLYTPPDKNWFPWFRFYGPEKAVLDKSWKMPDIERIN